MTEFSIINPISVLPELFLVASALLLLIVGVINGDSFALKQIRLSKGVVFITLFLIMLTPLATVTSFGGMFVTNGFTSFTKVLVLIGAFLSLYLALGYYKDEKQGRMCEFSVLVLLATAGMLLMISANNLLSLYMGLEMQSLALYVLAAINRENLKSSEAGLKYFILGALSSGIILYGISLIYGFSGTTDFSVLHVLYSGDAEMPIGVLIGLVFLIAGLCFKVSAAPFHMWTPDVYEGSPMPVTAFFAVAPKIAGMAIFVRLVMYPFAGIADQWQQIIIFVSAASMIVGALGAIQQSNIKRLIAYSSIGHVGYMLVGLASTSGEGVKAILLYLVIYITLSVGIFACIMMVKRKEGQSEDISSFSGLAKSNPALALAIAVLMFSMAGIPPFAGFFGKFFIFLAAVKQELYVLSVIGVLSSVVAAFYYLRIVKIMYLDEATVPLNKNINPEIKYIALAAAVFNLLFFFGFTPFVNIAGKAASLLF